jgi:hypothetical protein
VSTPHCGPPKTDPRPDRRRRSAWLFSDGGSAPARRALSVNEAELSRLGHKTCSARSGSSCPGLGQRRPQRHRAGRLTSESVPMKESARRIRCAQADALGSAGPRTLLAWASAPTASAQSTQSVRASLIIGPSHAPAAPPPSRAPISAATTRGRQRSGDRSLPTNSPTIDSSVLSTVMTLAQSAPMCRSLVGSARRHSAAARPEHSFASGKQRDQPALGAAVIVLGVFADLRCRH